MLPLRLPFLRAEKKRADQTQKWAKKGNRVWRLARHWLIIADLISASFAKQANHCTQNARLQAAISCFRARNVPCSVETFYVPPADSCEQRAPFPLPCTFSSSTWNLDNNLFCAEAEANLVYRSITMWAPNARREKEKKKKTPTISYKMFH